jgi:hypothetical protein
MAQRQRSAPATPREVAEAFSGHRFRDAYPGLAPDVRWTIVGAQTLVGREAVVEACETTLADLAGETAEFLRFLVIADDGGACVDAVGRYVSGDGSTTAVSSCDVYTVEEGLVRTITSYVVELDPATLSERA